MGTHLIFETVAHFEPLVAAELAPRCRTGVAWICWARCALSVGVVGLEMSRVSSPCVAIDEQMEEDRIDDDRTAPHAHESRPFPLASCSPSVLLTVCRGPPQNPSIIAPPETHPFLSTMLRSRWPGMHVTYPRLAFLSGTLPSRLLRPGTSGTLSPSRISGSGSYFSLFALYTPAPLTLCYSSGPS